MSLSRYVQIISMFSTPVTVKIHEASPCVCGHAKIEHAEFIDNQASSPRSDPERRHCMHGDYDGSPGGRGRACDCYRYRPATNGAIK